MKKIKNKFGEGEIYNAADLHGAIFCSCAACMSIYSEFLTWANTFTSEMTKSPEKAKNIVVLSCQVTDLAVLNDLRTLELYMEKYPGRNYFVGGCLARRFDIALPKGVKRLDALFVDNTIIKDFEFVKYEKPFWVKDFTDDGIELDDGHLFRKMYPLRIGVGCKNKCTYCTIRVTRGDYREIPFSRNEFLKNEDVLLIADSPTSYQIIEWCGSALVNRKQISIRNIEPKTVVKIASDILRLAQEGLLKYFHSPIQHTNKKALLQMGRNPDDASFTIAFSKLLRALNVITATNIIVDYMGYGNPSLNSEFDYVSWNPFWDGVWDREKAERRFVHYFGQ